MFHVNRKMYTFALNNNDFAAFLPPNVCTIMHLDFFLLGCSPNHLAGATWGK